MAQNTPILPGVYGRRLGSGGSPIGALGTQLIAVLGRGDKKILSPTMLTPEDIVMTKPSGGFVLPSTVFYKVTALNDQGETDQSQEVSVSQTGSGPTPHSVLVKWNLVRGATGYKIYRSTTSEVYPDPTLVVTIVGPATQFEDNNIALTTGIPPTTNTALWVAYNTPTLYFSMGQLRENFGADSELGKAAIIADRLQLSRLMVVSVDYTGVDAAAPGAPRIAALALAMEASMATLDSKFVDIVVPLEAEPAVTSKLAAHIDNNFTSDPKRWRVGFNGSGLNDTIGDAVTPDTIVGTARAINRNKILLTAPNTPFLSYFDDDGNTVTQEQQDGSMLAFAAAALKATVGDDAEQITNKTMAVFDKLGKDFNPSELEFMVLNGVTPIIVEAPGQQRVIQGLTTSLDSLEDASISIVMADLRLGKELVGTALEFIGKKITQGLLDSAFDKVGLKLGSLTGTLITNFSQLEVFQDDIFPNQLVIRFFYRVMYTTDIIRFEWQYDLTTGQALRRS